MTTYHVNYGHGDFNPALDPRTAPRGYGFAVVTDTGERVCELRPTRAAEADQLYAECKRKDRRDRYRWGEYRRWDRVHFAPFGTSIGSPEFWVYEADADDRAPGKMTLVLVSFNCGDIISGPGVTFNRVCRVGQSLAAPSVRS